MLKNNPAKRGCFCSGDGRSRTGVRKISYALSTSLVSYETKAVL